MPLSALWVALAMLVLVLGAVAAQWPLVALGGAGIILSAASAIFCAVRAPLERRRDNIRTRTIVVVSLLGSVVRGYTRGFARRWRARYRATRWVRPARSGAAAG